MAGDESCFLTRHGPKNLNNFNKRAAHWRKKKSFAAGGSFWLLLVLPGESLRRSVSCWSGGFRPSGFCGSRERGAVMAHAIRGAAAPAQSPPAPSSLPKNRGGSEYRLAARQNAPRSRRPSQYGARSRWHAPCTSSASRDRPVPRQRSLFSVRSPADFSKRRREERGRRRQTVRPLAHPAPWPSRSKTALRPTSSSLPTPNGWTI